MQTTRCLSWQATCCLCIFFSKKSGLPILNIYKKTTSSARD
jgi:hypothetical protein